MYLGVRINGHWRQTDYQVESKGLVVHLVLTQETSSEPLHLVGHDHQNSMRSETNIAALPALRAGNAR